ncbi:hypothetical protein CPB85DRAFT_1429860 [Mucidula mucida]|nr:hypothetical protein CPB85DRAFT_1429860 [Mucidula mucida]
MSRMLRHALIHLLFIGAALGATITIFDLQGPDSPPLPEQNDEVTFQVLGTNSAGATTFLEQVNITAAVQTTTIDGSAVTTTVSTAFTAEITYLISSGGYARLRAIETDTATIDVLEACTFNPQGMGRCIEEAFTPGGATFSTTIFSGSLVPFFTLVESESSATSSGASSSASSAATSTSSSTLTAPPTSRSTSSTVTRTVTSGGASSTDTTDAAVATIDGGLKNALFTLMIGLSFGVYLVL